MNKILAFLIAAFFASPALAQTLSPTPGCPLTGCVYTGKITVPAGSAGAPSVAVGVAGTGMYSVSTTGLGLAINGVTKLEYGVAFSNTLNAVTQMNFQSGVALGNLFAFINGLNANIIQLGALDNGTPSAQTLQVQNVSSGTSNTAGQNWSIIGSRSTGSGASGDILLQTGGTGAAATAQNTAVTALTIKGATQQVQLSNSLQLASISSCTTPTGANGNFCVIRGSSGAGFCTFEVVTTTNTQIIAANVPGGC